MLEMYHLCDFFGNKEFIEPIVTVAQYIVSKMPRI